MLLSRVLVFAVRYFNPIIRWVLSTRLHTLMSSRLMLITFTGRRSGLPRTTPVSYVREGSSLLVPGGGAWWKNMRDGRPVAVRLGGSLRQAVPELITEPAAVSDVLSRMLAANPALSVFTGIRPEKNGRPSPKALEQQMRRGFVIVRLRPLEAPQTEVA